MSVLVQKELNECSVANDIIFIFYSAHHKSTFFVGGGTPQRIQRRKRNISNRNAHFITHHPEKTFKHNHTIMRTYLSSLRIDPLIWQIVEQRADRPNVLSFARKGSAADMCQLNHLFFSFESVLLDQLFPLGQSHGTSTYFQTILCRKIQFFLSFTGRGSALFDR